MEHLNQRGKGRPNTSRPGDNRKICRCSCDNQYSSRYGSTCVGSCSSCTSAACCNAGGEYIQAGNGGRNGTWTPGASTSQPYTISAPAGGGTIGPAAGSIGFSGDMYGPSCGVSSSSTSVGDYVMGMVTVGLLFFVVGYSLERGKNIA